MTFFNSEIVKQDLSVIFDNYKRIAQMSANLPNMDHTGKIAHINETKALIEKQKLFYTRLCLAAYEDSEALEMKTKIDDLTRTFGYANMNECCEAMNSILDSAIKKELDDPS